MRYFQLTKFFFTVCCCCLFVQQLQAQCIESSSGPTGLLPCNAANQALSITTNPAGLASSVQWSGSGVTGSGNSAIFDPDCALLGVKQLTPFLPAGTAIPQQNRNIGPFNGNLPATEQFCFDNICYGQGIVYNGLITGVINGSASDQVTICVTPPSGVSTCIGPLDLPLVNGQLSSGVDIGLLLNNAGDPNGCWNISVSGTANSYNLNLIPLAMTYPNGLSATVQGPPVSFTVVAELPPCPTFTGINAPTQVCSGSNVILSANTTPGNAQNISYVVTGSNGFSYTGINPPVDNPENTTCSPITVTYNVTVKCTNNNTTIGTQTITATVYPEIDLSAVTIDNTSNINDPTCAVIVTAPCPDFTINGTPASASIPFGPGDNGSVANIIIGNGFGGCSATLSVPVTCIGNCVTPTTTVTTECSGSNNFKIRVSIADLGDATTLILEASQGAPITVTAAGDYLLGNFPNNTIVNVKALNPDSPSCNVNLGNFTQGCKPCPNITGIQVTNGGNICTGTTVSLNAQVTGGFDNTDYTVQWQLDGVDIPGGTGKNYAYNLIASGCQPQTHTFTAVVTCLTNGTPAANQSFTTNTITVYPIPEFGVDFFAPDNCSVTPVASPDCAPYLTMSTNPSPPGVALGQQVQVIYNVRVTGAPTSCRASGRYTVGCTDPATCTEDAGAMEPGVQTVCWGDDFAVVKSTPPLGLGFRNLITVTDELGTLVTTYGPYTSQDVVPPFAFTNNNSDPLYQAGKTYCFTPSLLFNGRDLNPGLPGTQNTYSQSGSASLPALDFDCVVDINSPDCTPEPYLYGFTVSGIPYCAGLSSYRITLVVNDNNITFNPWGGLAAAAGAGAYSSFPAPLDEQHDDGTWTLIYNGNPNGQTFNFVALQPNPLAGANINWSVTITLEDPPVFPVACPSCNDVGDAACVTLLQNPTLANITNPAPSCVGTTINLTDFNPDASQAGTYTWYNGDPSTTGTIISNPTAFELNQNTTFYVKYQSNVGGCEQMRNFTYNVNPLPTLNTPTVAPICPGATVNLSSLQPQITTAAGTFAWYIGDPDAGGAPLSNTTDVTPIGSERYYAVFTSTATGCKNKVYVSYTYNAIPVLLAQAPTVCAGTQVDLRSYEAAINANAGTFTWYNGNPDAGGTILTPNGNNQILVTPINGASYYVDYTNTATGCSNTARVVTFTVNALPTLATPTVTAVCAGTTVNLAQLQTNITTETGTFAWTSNGTSVANPAAVTLNATSSFTATFTASATTCSKSVTFNYPVNPSPIILNANVVAPTVCANGLVDLTDYQPQISTDSNISFTWYAGNPNISPALVVGSPVPSENPQTQQLAANETRTYYAIVAKNTGCQDTVQLTANAYSTLTGGSATYDCAANQLVVDLSTVTGGSGTGYATVVADTLQQNGDVIPELTIWQVLFTDSQGCIGTLITDTVKCIACNPNVGVSIPPSVLTVDLSQTTPQSGAAQGFTTPHSEALQGTPDFSFGVTDENGVIIGLSQDGSFTYLDDNGQPLLPGTYCFTPLVYNNIQVDQVADGFVGAGNYQLADLLAIAGNLVSPLTLDTVRSLLPTLENLSGVELCIQLGETPDWCVVASYDIPCFTPNPPTNPQNNSYCTDAAPTPLSVTGGNDTLVVRWFDAQTGGNLLYTGNPYTPDQTGTYWVELARLFNEDECRSTRIAVTLTSATPPATANVTVSVTLSNGQNPDFPTTVDLDNLVTGNTAGTWTAPSGLTYNNTSHVVNANGKTPGVYTAIYTINAPDPCADLVYTVVINVAGACQSPDATNPQGATYCLTDAIPSISVDEPGSEYIVNWYAQEFGGNPIGTGASFTPPGPGTYWAGVARADDETCLSLNRVSATLTVVEPEDRPLIEALEMCLNYGTINPLVFADITPEGGTGTWSCVTPSAGCSATAFNPTAAGVGNYTIRYTVTNATCGTQTYDIPISVVATCNDAVCSAAAGTALPPNSTTAYINNINPALNSAQASPGYAAQPSNAAQGTPNHSFVITDPTGIIVGLSLDGSFDFTGISPTGNYCFTGLAYDAGQIDAAADLLSTNPIVPAGALGTPADFHTLAELLEVVKDLGLINPFNIANVQAALPQLGAITGLTLCLNFNTTPDWCISVLSDEPCPSVPNPSGGSNQTYCNDGASTLPQLCVNDPGADFVVTWFDAASGGNVVGTGVCLSPTTTGDYWAEISSATRTECISTSRKKLTLTATQPPTAPTDFNTSGGLLYNDPQGGATSLNLSSLVIGGASGTWSAATGNPQSGVLSGSTVNANGAATGDYIFIYTINATAPCTALTYQTTVQVVDAGCLTAAHIPVATQTAISYCSNAAVPSISVQASSVANNEVVNWYNAANTLVGTGTSFTPTAAGVYCAQLAQADDATCVSSERACVTLTAVSPATATVTNTATAYVATGQTTATVDLCSLTTNTAGTWSENGAGTITSCNFTAPEGVYTVQYTLPSGNATCPATVYNVTANIVNCGVIVCTANPGTPLPPANLQVCLNQGSSVSSPSLGFSTPPSGPCQGTPDYTYIVTDNGGIIIGITNNLGEFDFAGLPLGSYCFTGLAYNTVQIDAAADALLGAGDYTLDDLLEVARTSGLVNPFTIPNVAANLPLIGTLTGLSLCTGFGSSPAWCVDVIDVCTSTCTTPAAPTAVNPTNTICTGSTIPALSVTTAAGTSVKWYNNPTGGTSIATGNSFTPTACGTYYAETWNATPADCFSATRTALTVTCVAPPTSAVVTASANINKASCPTGNSLSLSGLIASGNTSGTWTSTAGGTIAGNSFTAANAGTYTLTYTIAGTSPCANLTYTCVVTVINCSCVAPAAPTAVAANLTACEGSALPALQVTTAANTNVNWFTTAVGGTSIATGTSFTPNSCGVYYAETFRLDDATCVSTTRTAITLTCVTPITVSVTPITVFLAEGATTADVDLTTLNLPQGTWALGDCGGTITNNIYTGNEGTCTLTYTINQPSPCADNSINVSVTIVGCGVITCEPFVGEPIAPTNLCVDANNTVSAASTGFSVSPSGACQGTPDYTFIVTDSDGIIVDVTNNVGEFDFASLPYGNYCFTGLTYNATQVDAAADVLLGAGTYTLSDLLGVAQGVVTPFTIANVATNLPTIGTLTGVSLCIAFGDAPAWCITYTENCNQACTAPDAPIAVNANNSICTGSTIPALTVTTTVGTTVKWYDTPTGGTAIATGNSFTPTACGTYYAEAWNVTPADCFSATRTALTVTCVAPPTSAVVAASAQINKANCATNNSLLLSDLITSGNTGGTWTSTVGGTIAGNTFTAANTGSYTLTYTIAATSPCANLTYTCVVTVNDCSCVAPAAPVALQNSVTVCADINQATIEVSTETETTVTWFDAPTGGNVVGNGTTLTTTCGTYYAQAERLSPENCISLSRTAVTIVCVEPLEQATLAPSAQITKATCDTNNSIDLFTLITSGNTNGTWTLDGNLIVDGIFSTDALGTYQLTYTLAPADPCPGYSYVIPITVTPCQCNATAPTGAQNATVCEGNTAAISVDDAPTGYGIQWFDAPTGGTTIATGNSFTPTDCGTYYAQMISTDDATCTSSRTAVTLTCVTPIAAVATSVTQYLAVGATTADIDLCALDLPPGTWTVGDCGGTISNDGCTYTGGEGSCVLVYTIDQPAPCDDNTLSITVTILTNSLPILGDDTLTYTLDQDTDLTTNIIVDAGATDPEGGTITLVDVTQPDPTEGTVTFDADGNIIFTPADGFTGTVTIGFTIADDAGNQVSGTITIAVQDTTCVGLAPIQITQLVNDSNNETYTVSATIAGGLPATNPAEPYLITLTIVRNDTVFETIPYTYLPGMTEFSSDALPYLTGDLPFDVIIAVTDNSGCTIATDTLQAVLDPNVGIGTIANNFELSVSPIPTTNLLNISFATLAKGNTQIKLYDAAGKLVLQQTLATNNTNTVVLDVAKYPAGVYFLSISNAQGVATAKVIKQ